MISKFCRINFKHYPLSFNHIERCQTRTKDFIFLRLNFSSIIRHYFFAVFLFSCIVVKSWKRKWKDFCLCVFCTVFFRGSYFERSNKHILITRHNKTSMTWLQYRQPVIYYYEKIAIFCILTKKLVRNGWERSIVFWD